MILAFLLLLLLAMAMAMAMADGDTPSLNSEGLALLAFKNAVAQDSTGALADWNESSATPCKWTGVSCTSISGHDCVVGLSLTDKFLSGYIPSELGALSFLRRLNLHGNRLTGSIPSQLCNATELHSLLLHQNQLSGPLPPELARLPRLQNLDLSANSLSGSIPPELAGTAQLQRLVLRNNNFSGPVPSGLGRRLRNLVQLDLSCNRLSGSIPPELGELSNLTGTLNLSFNHLSGAIPKELGRLPLTVSLDLRNNDLTGPVPQDGSLSNQGPTAFLNNPKLCGFPLKISCGRTPAAATDNGSFTATSSSLVAARTSRKGLKTGVIVAICVGDAVGIALLGLLFVFLYWRTRACRGRCRCPCARADASEDTGSGSGSGSGSDRADEPGDRSGEGDLVAIDKGFSFELDELLRSSAYVLGKSALGIVYKVVLGSGVPVAVRRLGEGGSHRFKEFEAEVQTIGRVRHPNIVKLRAYYWSAEEKLLVSDYIPNGSLATALHGRSGQPAAQMRWAVRLKIAKGIARGLAHLHECSPRKYVHGDIKPSNILLDNSMQPYISDFGLGRLLGIVGSGVSSTAGAQKCSSSGGIFAMPASKPGSGSSHTFINSYQAPEASSLLSSSSSSSMRQKPTQKWDVYSFGLVLLELLTGRSPAFQMASFDMDLVTWVKKAFEEEHPLSEIVDPALLQEIHAKKEVLTLFHAALACVEFDPDSRPRMRNVSESLNRIGPAS